MADNFVTQSECQERRQQIADDYKELAKRVGIHGHEIDEIERRDVAVDERLKHIENIFGVLSKIMITIVGALLLMVVKGALSI